MAANNTCSSMHTNAVALVALLLIGVTVPPRVAAAPDCVDNPTAAACAAFTLPTALAAGDVGVACRAAPMLSGCSLARACAAQKASTGLCDPFTLLATICGGGEPGAAALSGCRARYNSLCRRGTAVRACATALAAAPRLVPAAEAIKQARAVCDEMDMEGCERCAAGWKRGDLWGGGAAAKCDALGVYSWLCLQMPGMAQCGAWSKMCASSPKLYVCAGEPAVTDRAALAG